MADPELDRVRAVLEWADPDHHIVAGVLRTTFDQLYDGVHTGRYQWSQLYKTEKTHFGTLIEINLRRELSGVIGDGTVLDYQIDGIEVDCKYSQRDGGWMLPPEALDHVCLVLTADDANATWSLGVVRASAEHLSVGQNRDGKRSLNALGRSAIVWLTRYAPLPPNVLLQLDAGDVAALMALPTGQARINQLLRLAHGRLVGRAVIATVARQSDYMKRIRAGGGARTTLSDEGYVIFSGAYTAQAEEAERLGLPKPGRDQVICAKVNADGTVAEAASASTLF